MTRVTAAGTQPESGMSDPSATPLPPTRHRGGSGAAWANDAIAGSIVAVLLVPQAMAYAMLAGLPVEVGLYAAVVPVAVYGLLGSSRTLSVGPVAVISLMVASELSRLAAPGSGEVVALALLLALLVGLLQLTMGLARLGFLVNVLSHSVMSGFITAAALLIGASQLPQLLGIDDLRAPNGIELARGLVGRLGDVEPATAAIGAAALALLVLFKARGERLLLACGVAPRWASALAGAGPFVVVALSIAVTRATAPAGVALVGPVPPGLPRLTLPAFDPARVLDLLPVAGAIALVGFMESFAVAKSLAARRREKVDADRELIALGSSNLAASLTGGYPVTGGFSRSMVNAACGARSGRASLITAALVALSLLVLAPLFEQLPRAVLAAVIIAAVAGLVDFGALGRLWRYSRADAFAYVGTFATVLAVGVGAGIATGIVAALVLFLWRTTRPHMAIVGRVGDSEHFRNVLRHRVRTWPDVLLVRVDESLYFGNAEYLEAKLLAAVAERPAARHLVLIAHAVNFIDASALELLRGLALDLREAGVTLHLAEVKGPVLDRLERVGFVEQLSPGRVFLSTDAAVRTLVAAEHPRTVGSSADPSPTLTGLVAATADERGGHHVGVE